ncbi:hypothetical protein [Kitasatospora aureofaciens]|uniref:hypothetical protein n=1 Tax=Kitasatospora aureofaciens TaxID=1894 RepID=UPI0037C8F215
MRTSVLKLVRPQVWDIAQSSRTRVRFDRTVDWRVPSLVCGPVAPWWEDRLLHAELYPAKERPV